MLQTFPSLTCALQNHPQGGNLLIAIENNTFGEEERKCLVRILVADLIKAQNDNQ